VITDWGKEDISYAQQQREKGNKIKTVVIKGSEEARREDVYP